MSSGDDIPPVPSKPHEYYNGVCDDGSRPNVISRELMYEFLDSERPPGEPEQFFEHSPFHNAAKSTILGSRSRKLEDLRAARDYFRQAMDLGIRAMQVKQLELDAREAEAKARIARAEAGIVDPEPAPAPAPEPEPAPAQEPAPEPEVAPAPRTRREAKPREYRPRPESLNQTIALGLRAAKELVAIGPALLEAEEKYSTLTADAELRKWFLQDRAVHVVLDMCFHMDEQFREVGFGNWMPFRYPDQWLMFCGVMQRVLAAHGLIKSQVDPEVWRKLLDETPPISSISEGAKIGPPTSYAKAFRGRTIKTFDDLVDRIMNVRKKTGPPK